MEPVLPEPEETLALHVDSDSHFLQLTATFLERNASDLAVRSETDPDRAIERLAEERIDCIVSGHEPPELDGLAFLEEVRSIDSDLPFVLFTSEEDGSIGVDAITAGVDSFVRREKGTGKYALLAKRIQSVVEQLRDRRRAAKAREMYELLARVSTDAFWIRDIETRETLYSEGIRQFGYEPGIREDGFQWWLERVHPEDRETSVEMNAAQEAGNPEGFSTLDDESGEFTHRYRWRCADGSYIDCLSRGVVRFENGESVEMIGAMTDVSNLEESANVSSLTDRG